MTVFCFVLKLNIYYDFNSSYSTNWDLIKEQACSKNCTFLRTRKERGEPMNKISLSNPGGKVFCVVGDLLIAAITVWMILSSALRGTSLLLPILCAAFMLILLLAYTYAVFSCAAIVDESRRLLIIRGMQRQEIDLGAVSSVDTAEVINGSLTIRVIRLLDGDGQPAASVSTMVLTGGGAKSEPLAQKLAEAIGAEFIPTLEPRLYDRAAKKEYNAKKKAEKRDASRRKKAGRKSRPADAAPGTVEIPDDFDENDALK